VKRARTLLSIGFVAWLILVCQPAPAQELFGVNVVVVPQSDSPVRVHQINIGEGDREDSPEIVLANVTGKPVHRVVFSTWMAQPRNCYDESRTPRDPAFYNIYFSPPLAPHSAARVQYADSSFLRPDLPLRDLLAHAPTHTVGYSHMQVAVESVDFAGSKADDRGWSRQHNRHGKASAAYDTTLYKLDHPDCNQWQAVVPRLRSMVGTEILVRQPLSLSATGAGVLRSGESGYFYTCAYVQKQDGSAFVCPSLSGLIKRYSGKR
jgi:hypothetical protein